MKEYHPKHASAALPGHTEETHAAVVQLDHTEETHAATAQPGNKRKTLKLIGNIAFSIVLVLFCVVMFFTLQSKLSGNAPSVVGFQMFSVQSGSMEPAIPVGSLVLMKRAAQSELAVGDVITFQSGDPSKPVVTHRIAAIKEGMTPEYTTKGDANDSEDMTPIYYKDIMGKFVLCIPLAGYVMGFAQSGLGLLALVIIPGALIIILEVVKLIKYAVQMDREKHARLQAEASGKEIVAKGGAPE